MGRWSPPFERSLLVGLSFMGADFGSATCMFITGVLTTKMPWEWAFYIYGEFSSATKHTNRLVGIVGIVWAVGFYALAADMPYKHRMISNHEKQYIEKALQISGGNVAKTSRILNVPRGTLRYKLSKYDLDPD